MSSAASCVSNSSTSEFSCNKRSWMSSSSVVWCRSATARGACVDLLVLCSCVVDGRRRARRPSSLLRVPRYGLKYSFLIDCCVSIVTLCVSLSHTHTNSFCSILIVFNIVCMCYIGRLFWILIIRISKGPVALVQISRVTSSSVFVY